MITEQKQEDNNDTTPVQKDDRDLTTLEAIQKADRKDAMEKSIRAFQKEKLPRFAREKFHHPLFSRWIDLAGDMSWAHLSYHLANILPIASMALSRRVILRISTQEITTNLFVMTAGVSTISGKSFSAGEAIRNFGKPVIAIEPRGNSQDKANPQDKAQLLKQLKSTAALVQELNDHFDILWRYDEAGEFFDDAGKNKWNGTIVPTLCSIYDGEGVERTLSRSNGKTASWKCDTPFVNLLFSMTNEQLKEMCADRILNSGFLYRWLWFIEEGGMRLENETPTQGQLDGVQSIRDDILKVAIALKPLDPGAICFRVNHNIEEWSIRAGEDHENDEVYLSSVGRGAIQIYKLAMIFAMFDPEFQEGVMHQPQYPITVDIPDEWADLAIGMYEEYLLPRMLYVARLAKNQAGDNKIQLVLNRLSEHGPSGCSRSTLLRECKVLSGDFNKIINTLKDSKQLKMVDCGGCGTKAYTMYYRIL